MRSRLLYALTLTSFIGVCALPLLLVSPGRITASDLDDLVAMGVCAYVDPVSVHGWLGFCLSGTEFADNYRVNEPHSSSALNIYIIHTLDSDRPFPSADRFDLLRDNAIAIGNLNTIIIDSALLYSMADARGVEQQEWSEVGYLLAWIIGHEVGHLQLGHGVSHYSPVDALFSMLMSVDDIDSRELDADIVFVDRIVRSSEDFTTPLVEQLIGIVLRADQQFAGTKGRPHYYFRAINALKTIHEESMNPWLQEQIGTFLAARADHG